MSAILGSVSFGFLAGLLSTLSPCVLPLLPLVLGPATSGHRLGLVALAAGVVASFVGIGMFVASVGFALGLDTDLFHTTSAAVLSMLGVVLLSSTLQDRFAIFAGGVSNRGNELLQRLSPNGPRGQFLVGLLLGAVWSPCVGPTLGAASLLAARGADLGSVAAVMTAFAIGAALPLLLIGSLSSQAMRRWRGRLLGAGKAGKAVLGGGTLAVGLLILTGFDRPLETVLVNASPIWLTQLTSRF